MNIIKLYEDYNIDYKTEGHKHCRPGWVNVECPLCTGNPGYHLGFPLKGGPFVCWRCGSHSQFEVIQKLLNLTAKETYGILKQYKGRVLTIADQKEDKKAPFLLPSKATALNTKHRNYLKRRGFDSDVIENHWGVLGTGPTSILYDKEENKIINFKQRLVIPIYWNGRIVSFQARDITDRSGVKYIACPKYREIIHHKHILYVNPINWEIMKGGRGVVVEGVTDVWKLGDFSIATFGIKYKMEQVRILAKHLKEIVIIYDFENQAQQQADVLIKQLEFRGVQVAKEKIENDPGSLSYDDAKHLMKQIMTKIY